MPLSQSAAQPSQNRSSTITPLCMPLSKFSHATVRAGSSTLIPWKHLISRDDLFVVFDEESVRGRPERGRRMRVLQDPNTLENIDLQILAQESRKAMECPLAPDQQPAVVVIVKMPCLAMRYPVNESYVQRFQVRFSKQEDFYETLKILTQENVPFVEAGSLSSRPATLPQDSSSTSAPSRTISSVNHTNVRIQSPPRQLSGMVASCGASQAQNNLDARDAFSRGIPRQRLQKEDINASHEALTSAQLPSYPKVDRNQSNISSSSQPVPQINAFVPRPSIAPSSSFPSPAYDLPPRRELPFERTVSSTVATRTTEEPSTSASELTATANYNFQRSETGKDTEDETVTLGKKRTAKQSKKAPTTRKARAMSSRKRPNTRAATAERSAALTVEEIIQQNKDGTTCSTAVESNDIDTQGLIDKVESTLASKRIKTTARRGDTSIAPIDFNRCLGEFTTDIRAVEDGFHPNNPSNSISEATVPDSSTTQVPVTGISAATSALVNPNDSADDNTRTIRNCIQDTETRKTTDTQPQSLVNAHAHIPLQMHTESQPRPHSTPTKIDLTNPFFTLAAFPSTTNPTSGTGEAQPEQDFKQQQEQLRAFIVQNFQNDEFLRICHVLDATWEAMLVKY